MKLQAEILGVKTDGLNLIVEAQVSEVAAARWRDMQKLDFRVSDIGRNRNTFRVGRALTITIEAK